MSELVKLVGTGEQKKVGLQNVLSVGFNVNVRKLIKEVAHSYNSGLESIREAMQNSFDSFSELEETPKVIFDSRIVKEDNWKSHRITYISDNGSGMDLYGLERFLGFGISEKDPSQGDLGEKGVGASYIYLADETRVYTRKGDQILLAVVSKTNLTGETDPVIYNITEEELPEDILEFLSGSGTVIKLYNLPIFDSRSLTIRRLKNYILEKTHAGSFDSLVFPSWKYPIIELRIRGAEDTFRAYRRPFSEDFEVGFNNNHPDSKIDFDNISSYEELMAAIHKVVSKGYKYKLSIRRLENPQFSKYGRSYIVLITGQGETLPRSMRIKALDPNSKQFVQGGPRFADTKQNNRGLHFGTDGLIGEKYGKNLSPNTNDPANYYSFGFVNFDFLQLTLNRNHIEGKEDPHMVEIFDRVRDEVYDMVEEIKEFRRSLFTKERNSENVFELLEKSKQEVYNLPSVKKALLEDERMNIIRSLRKRQQNEFQTREDFFEYQGREDLGVDVYSVADIPRKGSNLDTFVVRRENLRYNPETELHDLYDIEDMETLEFEHQLSSFKWHNHSVKIADNICCSTLGNWEVGEPKKMNDYLLTLKVDNAGHYIEANLGDMIKKIRVYVMDEVIKRERILYSTV